LSVAKYEQLTGCFTKGKGQCTVWILKIHLLGGHPENIFLNLSLLFLFNNA
jgi:hypothetical protein